MFRLFLTTLLLLLIQATPTFAQVDTTMGEVKIYWGDVQIAPVSINKPTDIANRISRHLKESGKPLDVFHKEVQGLMGVNVPLDLFFEIVNGATEPIGMLRYAILAITEQTENNGKNGKKD